MNRTPPDSQAVAPRSPGYGMPRDRTSWMRWTALGLAGPPNPGGIRTVPIGEPVEQVGQAVVVVLVRVAKDHSVDPTDAVRPEPGAMIRRPTAGSPMPPQS